VGATFRVRQRAVIAILALHTSCVCRIGHLGTSCVMRPRAEVGTVDSTLPPQELRRYRGRRSPAWNIQ
jgi:hypothetical protein